MGTRWHWGQGDGRSRTIEIFSNVTLYPPKSQSNVPDASVTWKSAATPERSRKTVTEEGGGS